MIDKIIYSKSFIAFLMLIQLGMSIALIAHGEESSGIGGLLALGLNIFLIIRQRKRK